MVMIQTLEMQEVPSRLHTFGTWRKGSHDHQEKQAPAEATWPQEQGSAFTPSMPVISVPASSPSEVSFLLFIDGKTEVWGSEVICPRPCYMFYFIAKPFPL